MMSLSMSMILWKSFTTWSVTFNSLAIWNRSPSYASSEAL